MDTDIGIIVAGEENEVQNVGTANEFRESILGLSVDTCVFKTEEISRDLHNTKDEVTKKGEILIIKIEKTDEVNVKEENVNGEEKRSKYYKTIAVSEGKEKYTRYPKDIQCYMNIDLFHGDHESQLFTTDVNYKENNSNSNYPASSCNPHAGANITEHNVLSIKSENVDYEEEITNFCSTSLTRKGNNAYTVGRDKIFQGMDSMNEDSIIKEEHELETVKIEESFNECKFQNFIINADVPIKECYVKLQNLSDVMQKSSFNINELPNSTSEKLIQNTIKKSEIEKDTIKAVTRNAVKYKQVHTNKESFCCKICNFIATSKLSLLKHTRSHTGKKAFCCNICEFNTGYKSSLILHLQTHADKKPFRCDVCEHSFTQKVHLTNHMRIHTCGKLFLCNICHFRTNHKESFVRHKQFHKGEKSYGCTDCEYTASRKSRLLRHMRIHTSEKPFICNVCQFSAKQKSYLVQHIRIHTGEKPYRCTDCKFAASRKSSLFTHMRTHTGEKPYRCTECDYAAPLKSTLIRHKRIHTVEKPFLCNICHFRTNHKGSLVIHNRVHTGEKPYRCTDCEYAAPLKSRLVRHMRIHTNEKPFTVKPL